jgi:imidazolonepropionase-like amidohydrolase
MDARTLDVVAAQRRERAGRIVSRAGRPERAGGIASRAGRQERADRISSRAVRRARARAFALHPHVLLAASIVASAFASAAARAQATPKPQLYAVRNVRLASAPEALKLTLILRDGRIAAIQDAGKDPPPDARVIDGQGLIALPAFIDGYAHAGCVTPTPTSERDVAPKSGSDVLVDMREANRKGVQPALRAADLFKLDVESGKRYRGSGFGALLTAPHGELLAGASALASTRDAAPRDVLLVPTVFDQAGFEAPGPGYPGTLMGAVAQLRQFFLDAQHQREISKRRAEGKPSSRPAYDADLEAIQPALAKQRRVACEAQNAEDIERWIKLSDEFGFDIAICGGRDAWKRAALLGARKIPVLLTLDWGEEVEDPHANAKKKPDAKAEPAKPDAAKPAPEKIEALASPEPIKPPQGSSATPSNPPAPPADQAAPPPSEKPADAQSKPAETAPKPSEPAAKPGDAAQKASESAAKPDAQAPKPDATPPKAEAREGEWNYEEPMRVREEKRRQWEETRDCALRLSEANVTFAFGSGKLTPKDLLDHVRTLVEKGLPPDIAQRALTTDAATLLGASKSLGKIEAGFDATLALWTKNPLTSKDAKLAWLIVDGFPYEFDLKASDVQGKPDEGVDVTGTWTFEFDMPEAKPAIGELKMSKDGELKATIRYRTPADDKETSGDFTGRVGGRKLKLSGKVKIGNFEAQVEIDGEVQGDSMTGTTAWKFSAGEDARHFKATRKPKGAGNGR